MGEDVKNAVVDFSNTEKGTAKRVEIISSRIKMEGERRGIEIDSKEANSLAKNYIHDDQVVINFDKLFEKTTFTTIDPQEREYLAKSLSANRDASRAEILERVIAKENPKSETYVRLKKALTSINEKIKVKNEKLNEVVSNNSSLANVLPRKEVTDKLIAEADERNSNRLSSGSSKNSFNKKESKTSTKRGGASIVASVASPPQRRSASSPSRGSTFNPSSPGKTPSDPPKPFQYQTNIGATSKKSGPFKPTSENPSEKIVASNDKSSTVSSGSIAEARPSYKNLASAGGGGVDTSDSGNFRGPASAISSEVESDIPSKDSEDRETYNEMIKSIAKEGIADLGKDEMKVLLKKYFLGKKDSIPVIREELFNEDKNIVRYIVATAIYSAKFQNSFFVQAEDKNMTRELIVLDQSKSFVEKENGPIHRRLKSNEVRKRYVPSAFISICSSY